MDGTWLWCPFCGMWAHIGDESKEVYFYFQDGRQATMNNCNRGWGHACPDCQTMMMLRRPSGVTW